MTLEFHSGLSKIYEKLQEKVISSIDEEGITHKSLLAIDRMLSIAKFIREITETKEDEEEVSVEFSDV